MRDTIAAETERSIVSIQRARSVLRSLHDQWYRSENHWEVMTRNYRIIDQSIIFINNLNPDYRSAIRNDNILVLRCCDPNFPYYEDGADEYLARWTDEYH